MRILGRFAVVPLAMACTACFQMTTVVKVNGDGSGTIDHTMLVRKAALAQLRSFGALGAGRGGTIDLTSEDQARQMADTLGPGVAYISSTALDTPESQGRHSVYAFADLSQVRISEQPRADIPIRTQALDPSGAQITCTLTHEANGNATIHINLPEMNLAGVNLGNTANGGNAALSQQIAMVRALLAGARVSITLEPAGPIVRTNSPFVEGSRVTLLDVDLDQLLANEALLTKLQAVTGPDDLKAALKDVPGLKMPFEREVVVEFSPAK